MEVGDCVNATAHHWSQLKRVPTSWERILLLVNERLHPLLLCNLTNSTGASTILWLPVPLLSHWPFSTWLLGCGAHHPSSAVSRAVALPLRLLLPTAKHALAPLLHLAAPQQASPRFRSKKSLIASVCAVSEFSKLSGDVRDTLACAFFLLLGLVHQDSYWLRIVFVFTGE